jgi:hypothetical protein
MHLGYWWESQKERDCRVDQEVGVCAILKWNSIYIFLKLKLSALNIIVRYYKFISQKRNKFLPLPAFTMFVMLPD